MPEEDGTVYARGSEKGAVRVEGEGEDLCLSEGDGTWWPVSCRFEDIPTGYIRDYND